MNYKKLKPNQIKFITIISIVLFFIVILSLKPSRNTTIFESIIKDGYSYIENFSSKALNRLKIETNIIETLKEYESENNQKEREKARLRELEEEIKRLKEITELNETLSEYDYTNATIINHNNGYWYNTIKIDKGEADGIKRNMAVINNNGLIGKVIKTTKKTSTIELLSNDNYKNKISIKIESNGKYIYGLLTLYNNKKNLYRIEGISENTPIKEGDLVTTTGFSEIYPAGIIVGTVFNITNDNFDLTRIVEVKPSVNFDSISYVTILKGTKND